VSFWGWIIVSYGIHKLLAEKQIHYLNCAAYNMWGWGILSLRHCLVLEYIFIVFQLFFLFADTSCKMIRQYGKIGLDADWWKSGISPFESENSTIEYCEDRCLKIQSCVALHYTANYCFIYYEISILEDSVNSVVSEKNCSNTPRK
jgi:hypothetical protein